MAIRFKNVGSALGRITIVFDDVTGDLLGAFNEADATTGIIQAQLNLTGLLAGSFQFNSLRMGTISALLGNLSASLESSGGFQFPAGAATPSAATLTAVATFHSIGLYWSETSGTASNTAMVRFKKQGTNSWRRGHNMVWDNRVQGNTDPDLPHQTALAIPYGNKQYRVSLVELDPGSTYNVEVMTQSGTRRIATGTFNTWSETFAISSTVQLGTNSTSLLNITNGGSAGGGYRLYTHAAGGSATIDGNRSLTNLIVVDAPYVILRDLTLVQAKSSCILLTRDAHHFVLEDSDLSDWGQNDPVNPQFGCNGDYGVTGEDQSWPVNQNVKQIVIQNNRIHHPFTDANSWTEPARTASACGPGSQHPAGAQAIFFKDIGGNCVFRYNRFDSDFTHMFDDIMGGGQNFSYRGAFGNDTDIYGNDLSHCWDDGLESEGGNANTRIWENRIQYAYMTLASMGCCSIGPAWAWRNISTRGIRSPGQTAAEGRAFKSYGKTTNPGQAQGDSNGPINQMTTGGGRVFLYHNTIYKSPSATVGNGTVQGPINSDQLGPTTITDRNNIWDTQNSISSGVVDFINAAGSTADFDRDVVGAGHTTWNSIEANAIVASPTYEPGHASGEYTLANTSPGRNVAEVIPNFNDQYVTPDVGAQERGAPALQFGVR